MMQVQGSAARVNGEGTYTDSRDHGKQFSVGGLGNFDKSEETKMEKLQSSAAGQGTAKY